MALAAESDGAAAPVSTSAAWSAPALGFLTGAYLHMSYNVDTTWIGSDRISIDPYASPPDDALVQIEGHRNWGRIATAVIVTPSEQHPEYLSVRTKSSNTVDCARASCVCTNYEFQRTLYHQLEQRSYEETLCCDASNSSDASCRLEWTRGDYAIMSLPVLPAPALRDEFVIYLEQTAPAGSEFALYLFRSGQEVTAGYHLVHGELAASPPETEQQYYFTVNHIDQPILNYFQSDVTPTGLIL